MARPLIRHPEPAASPAFDLGVHGTKPSLEISAFQPVRAVAYFGSAGPRGLAGAGLVMVLCCDPLAIAQTAAASAWK
jgi:hypothetical protein